MLNKKNIAIAMTAATAVSAFAPMATAFAAVVDSTNTAEIQAIKDKAAQLMIKKFTTDANLITAGGTAGSRVCPTITVERYLVTNGEIGTVVSGTTTSATNYAQFETALDKQLADLESGQAIKVTYNELGNRELEDGQIVNFEEDLVTKSEFSSATTTQVNAGKPGSFKVTKDIQGNNTSVKMYLSTVNNEERFVDVNVDDVQLDPTSPKLRTANGYYVDENGRAIQKVQTDDIVSLASNGDVTIANSVTTGIVPGVVVDGFYPLQGDLIAPTTDSDLISKDAVVKEVEMKASEMFNVEEGRLNQSANEAVRAIKALDPAKYDITVHTSTSLNEITIVIDEIKAAPATNVKLAEIKIVKDAADIKGRAFDAIKAMLTMGKGSGDLIFTAAGSNRYQTAVEVSKIGFTNPADVNELVLVSGANEALVDGLTATPLAASLNTSGAPVLLTSKDSIPTETMNEILRLDVSKIYVVGGESVVSDTVVNTLKNRYGISVERLSGDTRYETSLAVAQKVMDLKPLNAKVAQTYLVGGNGMADALSIASKAGENKSPILLTRSNEIDRDTLDFITTNVDDKNTAADVYVVGGNTVVEEAVLGQIEAKNFEVKRLAGDRRQDTNAAVIKEFYIDGASHEVIFAKSNDTGLVDALGAGALGAKYGIPVILATDELSSSQKLNLEDVKVKSDDGINKIQVGYGIGAAIASFIKGL